MFELTAKTGARLDRQLDSDRTIAYLLGDTSDFCLRRSKLSPRESLQTQPGGLAQPDASKGCTGWKLGGNYKATSGHNRSQFCPFHDNRPHMENQAFSDTSVHRRADATAFHLITQAFSAGIQGLPLCFEHGDLGTQTLESHVALAVARYLLLRNTPGGTFQRGDRASQPSRLRLSFPQVACRGQPLAS
jgi:hypothetical protein